MYTHIFFLWWLEARNNCKIIQFLVHLLLCCDSGIYMVMMVLSNSTLFYHICRLKDVQTLEELGDVYNHFLLYYGRDIPKMQNAAKANKKKLKKIKEVSETGKSWMIN